MSILCKSHPEDADYEDADLQDDQAAEAGDEPFKTKEVSLAAFLGEMRQNAARKWLKAQL